MQAQLTVRLPEDLERKVSRYAKKLRLKRSDIVRMALERFLDAQYVREEPSPYGSVQSLIGSVESGIPDLGKAHRDHLLKRMRKRA